VGTIPPCPATDAPPPRGPSNLSIADSRPSRSYLQAGTLPRLISFVCHSCENCRVCTQNSHSETLSLEFANLPSTSCMVVSVVSFAPCTLRSLTLSFVGRSLRTGLGVFPTLPFKFQSKKIPPCRDCRLPTSSAPLQRVTGHRSRVSDHASFSSSLLTSLPHYLLAPSS